MGGRPGPPQVAPKVLFTCDGFVSAGKTTSIVDKIEELAAALPSLERVVVVGMTGETPEWSERLGSLVVGWDDFLASGSAADGAAPPLTFTRVPFAHPQFVLYSSGTTGMPKSIAHGCGSPPAPRTCPCPSPCTSSACSPAPSPCAGNLLLQHAKELLLHSDLRAGDKMLFYTTCGWMMWCDLSLPSAPRAPPRSSRDPPPPPFLAPRNWMASSLFAGAAVVCFDGFAAYPKLSSPWELIERERVTHMGTSPRFLQAHEAGRGPFASRPAHSWGAPR